MSSESGDQNPARLQNTMTSHPPPPRTDPLPCPRCASTNTKFCYYNNYNLSQPRYFCKGCRRYWTQGGTLRNVPVGGGTRKGSTSKRHRSSPSSSSNNNNNTNTNTTSSASSTLTHEPGPEFEPDPILLPLPANPVSVLPVKVESNDMNLNESLGLTVNLNESYPVSGNFATFLDIQGPGSLNMGGYGLDEMGLGFGPTRVWPFLGTGGGYLGSVNGNNGGGGGGGGGGSTVGCNNTWQMGDVENGGGVVDGDCYGWPGLAISTPGKGLK